MNVLCADKTGTLTEGTVELKDALDAESKPSEKALLYAYLNSYYETGFTNPIDAAIRAQGQFDVSDCQKLDEVPYDFVRKRLSILLAKGEQQLMITKGAVSNVLDLCSSVELPSGCRDITEIRERIKRQSKSLGDDGFRTLGLAYKHLADVCPIGKEDEVDMVFLALLVFFDPSKAGVFQALDDLRKLGIALKVITGDNVHVATSVTRKVLGYGPKVLTGGEVHLLSDDALRSRARD